MDQLPLTDDTVIFGLLALCLGLVFYTSSLQTRFWQKFYTVVPTVLLCYLLPAILASTGIVSEEASNLYFVASRYLLPAALILMTLSIDLKAIVNLGPKALIMFFTGTVGIIIGGPYNSGMLATAQREQATYDYKPVGDALWEKAQKIRQICEIHGVDVRTAALQYPLLHPAVASVIPGSISLTQLEENLELFHRP
ncbi:MAG: hypothetical protein COA80_02050, partial [Leeuwenhoekiella sp.]